jgi:methyl-accepting chemotaxis protein
VSFLKNINISVKIFGGFGLVIGLLLLVGLTGWLNLSSGNTDFQRYRSIALQTNQAGRVQANLLEARLAVKNFIIDANQTNIAAVNERAAKALELNKQFSQLVHAENKSQVIATTENDLNRYQSAFSEVTNLQARRDEVVNNALDVIGPQIERKLTEIMLSAFSDNDAVAAFRAGTVQRNLLLMRLYATKFLVTNDVSAYERTLAEANEMRKNHDEMLRELNNPTRRQLAKDVSELQVQYVEAFEAVNRAINSRNDIIKNTLDRIGPKVAGDLEELKLSIKKEQDTLGPEAVAASERAVIITIIVSLIGLLIGAFAAWAIGNGITRPITAITQAMNALAGGNKETAIPGQDHKDEVGLMASAVQVFKENMIQSDELRQQQKQAEAEEADRLLQERQAKEEQARLDRAREQEQTELDRQRSEKLQASIMNFDTKIGELLGSVAEASNDLKNASNAMRDIAAESDNQSGEAASASERASSNVSSVAAASEEMAASVQEITRQVAKSSEKTNQAADQAASTNTLVQNLATNVSEIDDVVRIINDIADQTNLLALNATIEAARAGDAGKGFAVVASEVKALANQTGQATDSIQQKINVVQDMSSQASSGMDEMVSVFNETSEISGSIAAAVEEQNASTSEISQAAGEAANGTGNVTSNIGRLRDGVQSVRSTSEQVYDASETLAGKSQELRSVIESFLNEIEQIQAA